MTPKPGVRGTGSSSDIKARREAREQELAEHRAGRKLETSTSTTRRKELEERRASGQSGAVDDEVRRLSDKRQVLLGERDAKLAAIEERTRQDLRPLLSQLDAARRANDVERYTAIKRRIASVNGRAEKEKARADGNYKAELSRVEEAAESLADERFKARRKAEEAIKSRIDQEDEREHTQVAEASRKQDALVKEIGELREAEAAEISKAALKRKQRDAIDDAIQQEEQKHRTITAESQLHRIASPVMSWWYGKTYEPHTVADVDVRRVALVWFGSMALLGAWGGAAVAMVSQLLAKGVEDRSSQPTLPGSAARHSRFMRLLVTLRLVRTVFARRPKPKEVIKIRREVVAVPIPVSGVSLPTLQTEFDGLRGTLSEFPEKKA